MKSWTSSSNSSGQNFKAMQIAGQYIKKKSDNQIWIWPAGWGVVTLSSHQHHNEEIGIPLS
jgi:hypothetical protein